MTSDVCGLILKDALALSNVEVGVSENQFVSCIILY